MRKLYRFLVPEMTPRLVTAGLGTIFFGYVGWVFLGLFFWMISYFCLNAMIDKEISIFGRVIAGLTGVVLIYMGGYVAFLNFYDLTSKIKLMFVGKPTLGRITDVRMVTKKTKSGVTSRYHFRVKYLARSGTQEFEVFENGHNIPKGSKHDSKLEVGKDLPIIFNPKKPLQAMVLWDPPGDTEYIALFPEKKTSPELEF